MILKFMHKLWLVLFATIVINSFGYDTKEDFGCHNISVDKMVKMKSNKIFGNLIQCMQDIGVYNEKNLNIAKKLQNDLESAEKFLWWTDIFRIDGYKQVCYDRKKKTAENIVIFVGDAYLNLQNTKN